MSDSPGPDVN